MTAASVIPIPLTANQLTQQLLISISERYNPHCLMFRLNVFVAIAKRGHVRSAPNGSPDLIGCIAGRPVAIEVKAGKDRLSREQQAFCDQWREAGGVYVIARDVQQVMNELEMEFAE